MTGQEAVGWILLALPIAASFGGLAGAMLIKSWKPAREVAIASADYVEAVKEAVESAERYGITNRLPGAEKFTIAVKAMDKWFDDQGIHGDAKLVTLERAKSDIELMRVKMFPKVN